MNNRQRFIAQLLILMYAVVGTIAFCDYLDKKNSEENAEYNKNRNEIKQSNAITTYSTEDSETTYSFSIDNCGYGWFPYTEPITNIVYFTDEQSIQSEMVGESLEIPYGWSDCYMYMDYRAITDTSSKQWELQNYAWTDWQGFRRIGDDYCVALGTYYGQIGDRFQITTDRGNVYTVIEADAKGYDAVSYDGWLSWYHVCGDGRLNVVEFITQTECMPWEATVMGDCGVLDNIGGNIISIVKVG